MIPAVVVEPWCVNCANLWHSMQHCAVEKKQVTFLLNLYHPRKESRSESLLVRFNYYTQGPGGALCWTHLWLLLLSLTTGLFSLFMAIFIIHSIARAAAVTVITRESEKTAKDYSQLIFNRTPGSLPMLVQRCILRLLLQLQLQLLIY